MEPFGLFQFLQNLLPSQPSSASDTTSEIPPKQAENTDGFSPRNTEINSSQNQAVLQFFSSHDERVKRTKQKR